MEISWKVSSLCFALLSIPLCDGLPIKLENTVADSHTQFLTGLVAVLLTVCSIVFLAGCLCCQRRNGFKEFRDSPVVISTASNLDHGHINPVANSEFTIFTPLSPPHQNNNVFLANQQIITRTQDDYRDGDLDVSSWFAEGEKDFPRIKLKYIREIGKGWFGKVVEGAAQDLDDNRAWTPVAVRILEATASKRERIVFLDDAAIYRCGRHPNVLRLMGRCLDTIPLLLLQEYCPQGCLKKYLRSNKSSVDKSTSADHSLVWCCQLTSALKHLHDSKLVHPDLATRNCQLTSNLQLKLGDYGLAIYEYPDDYYRGTPSISVRWCAPESVTFTSTTIQPKKITPEANIWSLAVTMWEICEWGEQPYAELTDDEVVTDVLGSQNVRLTRPSCSVLYTDYLFRLMQMCWTSTESRPTISQIDLMLNDLLQVHKNTTNPSPEQSLVSVEDFDRRWESLRPNNLIKSDISQIPDEPIERQLSPSLNNLHGSLDNILVARNEPQMESWLEDIATKTGDMSYVQGLSDAIKDLDSTLDLENVSSSESSHRPSPGRSQMNVLEFRLGPIHTAGDGNDSLPFIQRTSSESETEDENWKKKIERGAYTEKVRLKSRSVADLMVLTHIDYSESESETPLPSLDYRINYKNVRYAPKQNLENCGKMYGSEGNLLNVQETFQEELRKLQEERRDSLLFVPDKCSQNRLVNNSAIDVELTNYLIDESPSKRLMQDLNGTSELKPANQIYNVFNVTIDTTYSPVHRVNTTKLNEIINFNDDLMLKRPEIVDGLTEKEFIKQEECISNVPDEQKPIIRNDLADNMTNLSDDLKLLSKNNNFDLILGYNKHIECDNKDGSFKVPKLVDLIQDNDELMDYIIAKYETDSLESRKIIDDTKQFLATELEYYEDFRGKKIEFDLSENQEKAMLNSLTHTNVYNNTPFAKRSLPEIGNQDIYSSLNLYGDGEDDSNLNYSLETWDNFLGNVLDVQSKEEDENPVFDSFSSEPQSLLFVGDEQINPDVLNTTFTIEKEDDVLNRTFTIQDDSKDTVQNEGSWETGGGWFLHPQSNEETTGEMSFPQNGDSYVGFNLDDEIMAAIRSELLTKLPQAQGGSVDRNSEDDNDESGEKNEIFLRYNVYNTPLSPIPEEENSGENTPKKEDTSDLGENESQSVPTVESSLRAGVLHRHTPSQDSCCSNDTLFNLEELTCAGNEIEPDLDDMKDDDDTETLKVEIEQIEEPEDNHLKKEEETPSEDRHLTLDFIENEKRQHSDPGKLSLPFSLQQVAPLPSPEDKPWKQLPASLLSYDKVVTQNGGGKLSPEVEEEHSLEPSDESRYDSVPTEPFYENIEDEEKSNNYENVEKMYENVVDVKDIYNEADYVNIVNMENIKNTVESEMNGDAEDKYMNGFDDLIIDHGQESSDVFGVLTDIRFSGPADSQLMTTSFSESNDLNDEQDWDSGSDTRSSSSGEFIWKEGEHEESLKALRAAPQDVMEDVKPMEDIQEESSSESSGSDEEGESPEFIPSAWDKYATPIKSALRSPEKTLEKTEKKKAKGVWFKKQKYHCVYEYPREPESPVLQSYDLWKPPQDYSTFTDWDLDLDNNALEDNEADENSSHSYRPKTNRILNPYQLINITDFMTSTSTGIADDEFFISSTSKPFGILNPSQFFPGHEYYMDPKGENATPDSGVEDITTSPAPVDDYGRHHTTTPSVRSLKSLATDAVERRRRIIDPRRSDALGGLRHTRDRLRLDLPPGPGAFAAPATTTRPFDDIERERPTFTTFGKGGRFVVQHVDTPPDDDDDDVDDSTEKKARNVSFEALPYKPLRIDCCLEDGGGGTKAKVEMVRGEASLLDSADEDSGIESSTLDRKSSC